MKRARAMLLLAILGLAMSGCWSRPASTDGTSGLRDDSMTSSPAGFTRTHAEQKYYLWADPP